MIGHEDAGNVAEQEFFFPAADGFPAVTIRATSTKEANAKFEALRQPINPET